MSKRTEKQTSAPLGGASDAARSARDTAARNTVLVALNHPQGIDFELADGRRVRIAGNAAGLRGREKGVLPVGAYGLTEIPAADWEAVTARYGDMPVFASGLIFAARSSDEAGAEAADKAALRHGREPVNPDAVNTRPADAESEIWRS